MTETEAWYSRKDRNMFFQLGNPDFPKPVIPSIDLPEPKEVKREVGQNLRRPESVSWPH